MSARTTSRASSSGKRRSAAPSNGHAEGHFGEVLQGRLGADGPVALVTLPCPRFDAAARFLPIGGAPLLVAGAPNAGAARLARAAVRDVAPGLGGRLRLRVGAPPGGGAGSSTLTLLATRRAALHASPHRASEAPIDTAAALLRLEGAVDPLMLERPGRALWGSRAARLFDETPPANRFRVVGGFDGAGRRTDPADDAFADVADLVAALIDARRSCDAAGEAAVATASARRNQARAPSPLWSEVVAAGSDFGALGIVAAHTGSALGLLFDPAAPELARRASAALPRLGLTGVFSFLAGEPA